jgi:hypothetical protein
MYLAAGRLWPKNTIIAAALPRDSTTGEAMSRSGTKGVPQTASMRAGEGPQGREAWLFPLLMAVATLAAYYAPSKSS